jgi:hypothetical protein
MIWLLQWGTPTLLLGGAAAIWWFFPSPVRYYAIAVLATLAAFAWVYGAGMRAQQERVDAQNVRATERSLQGVREHDACIDAGGLWDPATGQCFRREGVRPR